MRNGLPTTVAPVPTPIDARDRIDASALRAHLEWLASEGLDGALVLGTNGEFPSLTFTERVEVAEAAAATADRLQLLLGVGSCALGEVTEAVRVAAANGYVAVLCPPPFYFRSAPVDGLAEFFRRVLDRSSAPVLLYHIPDVTGVPIDDRLLDGLGDHDRLLGVKDSSGRRDELDRLLARFRNGAFYVGTDRLVRLCHERGGTGSISAAASVVPGLVRSVRGQPERQDDLDDVRALLEEYGLAPAVKAILRSKGFGRYATRPPLTGLDAERERSLLQRFRAMTR